MEKNTTVCDLVNGNKICVDKYHDDPFLQASRIKTILQGDNDYELEFVQSCKGQSITCFSTNLRLLSVYFFIYLLAAILINLLHELFHFGVFYFSGETVYGIEFGFNMGKTVIGEMPPVNSRSLWWWYLAIMGPLLFVNSLSIVVAYILYNPQYGQRIYRIKNPYSSRYFEIFLRAVAYLSSISIIGNTIMSPLLRYIFSQNYIDMQSDFTWAWSISLEMSDAPYMFSKHAIYVLITLLMVLILIMVKKDFKLKFVGISICVVLAFSILFFFTGISDRRLFQWLIISSSSLQIVFSLAYVIRFGKRIT